jgi:hypothetical protein
LRHLDAFLFEVLQKLLLAVDFLSVQDVVDKPATCFLTFQISPPLKISLVNTSTQSARMEYLCEVRIKLQKQSPVKNPNTGPGQRTCQGRCVQWHLRGI